MRYKIVKEGILRFHSHEENAGMLSRYRIINEGTESRRGEGDNCKVGKYSMHLDGDTISLAGGRREIFITAKEGKEGFEIQIPISPKERFYGLGDSARGSVMRRGTSARMYIRNVVGYGPMPYLMSSEGWAIFVNCTYDHTFDIGESDENLLQIKAKKGTLDFYILMANSMKELLGLYTDLTGKPMVLPKFAYGYTFVNNDQTNARDLLMSTKMMRERDIPCDTMGLEPTWMETFYDDSTDKKWDKDRFYLPHWMPANQSGNRTFFFNLREMGMQLSLWLCENYDLLWEEDGQIFKEERSDYTGAEILDDNFEFSVFMDKEMKHGEPWFEHLKKFVDNGASAFKLDGCSQVIAHPDRLWGGKYLDDEVHNVYPVLLVKQMQQGFKAHTGRRAFLNTAGAYAGTQRYAATWAGDTGGGQKTLLSVFNYSMCGHSNTSCDMDVTDPMALHYGFLLPWTQQNGWANWQYPWFLKEEREEMIRFYAKLRSSLIPYIYSMAHVAAETGLPILRPLPLMYEETDRFDHTDNLYMLGDSLLVGAFDMHFELPDGVWIDWFTGKEYSGAVDYEIPEGRGGAFFVKKGSVIVTMEPQKYILEKEHDYRIEVYPGTAGSFTLYEDDGFTFDYMEGKLAKTEIFLSEETAEGFTVTVKKREGSFGGRPDNGHNHFENSIPKIDGIKPVRDMQVVLHTSNVKEIFINDVKASYEKTETGIKCILPANLHEKGSVSIKVELVEK